MTRFPRNKSASWDKATKPSATKDECLAAMAQRHRPCIGTRWTRSCPSECPLLQRQKPWGCLCSCLPVAASALLPRFRCLPKWGQVRDCNCKCLSMGWKDKGGVSHNLCLSDLALFYSLSRGNNSRKVNVRKVKLLLKYQAQLETCRAHITNREEKGHYPAHCQTEHPSRGF